MLSGLLPGADRDLVLPLHKRLEKLFTSILLNTTVKSLKEEKNGIRVVFDGADVKEKEQVFDRVLMSVGRRPNSEIPGLDKTQVKVNSKGFIEINEPAPDRRSIDLCDRRCCRRTDAGSQSNARGPHRG